MIGYLALARDTFDINYALDNKKKFEKFIDILDIKYSHFKELITDDETGKKAIRYFKKLNLNNDEIVLLLASSNRPTISVS